MKDVRIDDTSCRKMGLIPTAVIIGSPELETLTIEIPGREGVLDCTEKIYGRAVRKNRKITMTFQTLDKLTGTDWMSLQEYLLKLWHGKMVSISIGEGSYRHRYKGRLTIKSFEVSGKLQIIQMEADCEPDVVIEASGSGGVLT